MLWARIAFLAACAVATTATGAEPGFEEGFEGALSRWRAGDDGAVPLLAVDARAASGKRSAYSGPPGRRRVSRAELAMPRVGRLEVRFYDDMTPAKHQMAIAVGRPRQILGIACRGGTHYQCRVGSTYTTVAVKRSRGWHLFAWECDGRKTVAFIDGTPVFTNDTLGHIREIVLGSFWDASTGWYDDVRAFTEPTGAIAEAEQALRKQQARLAAALREQLAADRPKLAGPFAARPFRPLGPETPLSRECYRRLLRYVGLTQAQMRDWPRAPACRYHKADNHSEWAVRQNATVALGYSVLLAGSYDEKAAGVPKAQLEADLQALLRYVAITHKANLLPTGDGSPWGDQWQSALWAHWAGQAAWLTWDRLDDELKLMFARLICHEADRFNTRRPDSGVVADTKAEENAWNSMVITLAACMFPQHPHAALWRERAIVYMINAYAREADRTSDRVVDGRPARERVSAVTIHPDFTLENHRRVHPDYLGCFGLLLRNALRYRAAGLVPPESLLHNVPQAWAVLKHLTAVNGSYFYVNGQDWWPHRHGSPLTIAAFTSVLLDDAGSAFLERQTLDFLGRMHARFPDGRAWDPREYNYRNSEEEMIARYAEVTLLHRLCGDGPPPVSREAFLRSQSGVRLFDAGGFVTHRTPTKFVSFAWVNGVMGLVYPGDDTWFTSPSERGMVGRIACAGLRDTTPKVLARKVATRRDGFVAAARIARCAGGIQQSLAVVSLAGEPVLYLERLTATHDVDVTAIATATAPILNEDAPGIAPNRRVVEHAGGAETIPGTSKAAPRLLEWKTSWANVDGKLGVATTASAMACRDASAYRRCRLEEELIGNYRAGIGRVRAGAELSACAVAFVPNQAADATRRLRIEMERIGEALLVARFDGTIVAANLGSQPAEGEALGQRLSLAPLEVAVVTP